MARERDLYLDTMEDLIGHPGWRLLEDEFKKQIYQFQADSIDINVCKSWDHVNVLRGAAQQLAELLALPDTLAVLRAQHDDGGE
jgi:hypothetical protein